mgnify:FL=1
MDWVVVVEEDVLAWGIVSMWFLCIDRLGCGWMGRELLGNRKTEHVCDILEKHDRGHWNKCGRLGYNENEV